MRPEKAPEISCFESLWTSPSTVSMLSLLMCTRHASHVIRVVTWITAVNRDAVRHNMVLLLHIIARSNSDLESIVFSGSTRLLWIRVSPGSSSGIAGQNDIHADPKWHSCRNVTDFNTLISQSNFCIFHNTTQSVIIYRWCSVVKSGKALQDAKLFVVSWKFKMSIAYQTRATRPTSCFSTIVLFKYTYTSFSG